MTTQLLKPQLSAALGLMLTLPTCYFILISVLKYILGYPALFDAVTPTLEGLGIKETLGWNINLLILFGPLLAFFLNASAITQVEIHSDQHRVDLEIHLLKRKFNWLVMGLSAGCLVILFLYLLGENCNG